MNWLTDWLIDWLIDCLIDELTDKEIKWLTDCQIESNYSTGWRMVKCFFCFGVDVDFDGVWMVLIWYMIFCSPGYKVEQPVTIRMFDLSPTPRGWWAESNRSGRHSLVRSGICPNGHFLCDFPWESRQLDPKPKVVGCRGILPGALRMYRGLRNCHASGSPLHSALAIESQLSDF